MESTIRQNLTGEEQTKCIMGIAKETKFFVQDFLLYLHKTEREIYIQYWPLYDYFTRPLDIF